MKTMETKKNYKLKKEVVMEGKNLPLTIIYKDRKYVLMLTKNDKLILNKAVQ